MIPRGPARFALLFVLVLAMATGGLFLIFGRKAVTPRKGIRIPTITGRRSGGQIDTPLPGLPAVRRSEGAEYSSYQTVTFPDPDGGDDESYEFLAAYLRLEKARPMDLTAEGVTVLIFPVPETIEVARTLGDLPPQPSVSIRAGRADLVQGFADTGSQSVWELTLADEVVVVSSDRGQEATLTAEIVDVRPEERQLAAKKEFRVESGAYTLEGIGLSGRAGLQTFRVERDIALSIPTSVLFPDAEKADAATRITCGGPLIFQREEPDSDTEASWIPYRVEFQRSVQVVQQGPGGTDRLVADLLTVELLVKDTGDEPFEPGPETIRARSVVASGSVDLIGAKGSRVTARAIRVTPGTKETRIHLTGATSFLHRGVLTAGTPEAVLSVRSGGDGTVVASADGTTLTATFAGGVSARRLDADGNSELSIDSDDLEYRESPDGRGMTATGGARFGLTGVSGRADRIEWKQLDETTSEVHLLGSPEVTAKTGASLDPFASGGTAAEEPKEAPPGDEETLVHLGAAESIILRQEGRLHTFRMAKDAVVRRTTGGHPNLRVQAAAIDVIAETPESSDGGQAEVRKLSAVGGVSASGRPAVAAAGEGRTMDLEATGERFDYDPATGRAVLTGAPAEVKLREDGEEWNSIAGRRLTFGADLEDPAAKPGHLLAEEEVSATVYLAEKKGAKPVPFSLNADRLEVETAGGAVEGAAADRISSLVASGNASLKAKDRVIRGDRLTYAGGDDRDIHIIGRPERRARIERTQTLAGTEVTDWFEATTLRVRLREQRVLSFESPDGGDLVFHRLGGTMPIDLGGENEKKKESEEKVAVERVRAHGSGRIVYDAEKQHLRIEKNAWVRQYVNGPDGFDEIARFRADRVKGRTERDESGIDVLVHVEGTGNVEGRGKDDTWVLSCDSFEIDLKHERLIVLGSPAIVKAEGGENRVERAHYDYGKDEWEFFRLGR